VPKGSVSRDQVQELIDAETAGDVAAAIAAAVGLGQLPYLQTCDPGDPGFGNSALTADTVYLRCVGRCAEPITITNFKINVATNAGNVDIALWSYDDVGTFTKVGSTGVIAPGGTGIRTLAATAPFETPTGVTLALSVVATDGALQLTRVTVSIGTIGAIANQIVSKASVGAPLPSTLATFSAAAFMPYIWAG
jgi:hypothetical protein